jgi:CBS domain-containing protein
MMRRKIVPDIVQQQEIWTLPPVTTVREAAKMMTQRRIGAVMVVQSDRLIGIFSERDLVGRVVAKGLDPDATQLETVMTRDPMTIDPDESPIGALDIMRARGFRHLPVVKDSRVVGMVSIRDLYAAVKEQLEDDLKERDEFMFGAGYGATA